MPGWRRVGGERQLQRRIEGDRHAARVGAGLVVGAEHAGLRRRRHAGHPVHEVRLQAVVAGQPRAIEGAGRAARVPVRARATDADHEQRNDQGPARFHRAAMCITRASPRACRACREQRLVQRPLAAGANQVVLAAAGEAGGVPAEVRFEQRVGGEAGGQLQADPLDAEQQGAALVGGQRAPEAGGVAVAATRRMISRSSDARSRRPRPRGCTTSARRRPARTPATAGRRCRDRSGRRRACRRAASRPANRMLLNLRSPWQTRGGSGGQRRQRGGAGADRARPAAATSAISRCPACVGDRLLQARQVAGRVVDADAHADEVVVQPVDRGVKAADQLAGRARLLGAADDVERHAVDVRQQPPEAAARRGQVGRAVARRQQARRDQARRRQALGHRRRCCRASRAGRSRSPPAAPRARRRRASAGSCG